MFAGCRVSELFRCYHSILINAPHRAANLLPLQHSSFYVPETHFPEITSNGATSSGPPARSSPRLCSDYDTGINLTSPAVHIICYGHSMHFCPPPVTSAAFLAVTARVDLDRRMPSSHLACLPSLPLNREAADALRFAGPTQEDIIEARSGSCVRPWIRATCQHLSQHLDNLALWNASVQYDTDWHRITLMNHNKLSELPLPRQYSAFAPGQLTGLWNGKFLVRSTFLSFFLSLVFSVTPTSSHNLILNGEKINIS